MVSSIRLYMKIAVVPGQQQEVELIAGGKHLLYTEIS